MPVPIWLPFYKPVRTYLPRDVHSNDIHNPSGYALGIMNIIFVYIQYIPGRYVLSNTYNFTHKTELLLFINTHIRLACNLNYMYYVFM